MYPLLYCNCITPLFSLSLSLCVCVSEHIPVDLRDPFYTDQYCVEHIKPPVLSLLLSSELYCRVCGLLLKGDHAPALGSHHAVLQTLARRGICVREADDTPVSHDDLSSTPIKMVRFPPLTSYLKTVPSLQCV